MFCFPGFMAVPVIAGFLRTPFAKAHRGALKDVRPDDFSAEVVKGLISKNNIVTDDLEDFQSFVFSFLHSIGNLMFSKFAENCNMYSIQRIIRLMYISRGRIMILYKDFCFMQVNCC